jgi:hypothetical protein
MVDTPTGGPPTGGPGSRVDLQGPASRLWRNVYRKAAEAAEARLRALLVEHVTHLHGRRAIVFTVDGGGAALVAGPGPDVELPWAYLVEGWSLYAHESGSATLDLRVSTYATFPTLASICGSGKPALSSAQKAQSTDVSGWTQTALPRGTVLRCVLESASTVTFLSLTLWVRAA